MVEDPAMSAAIDEQVDVSGSAPKAVLDAYEAQAQIFEQMEDEYFRGRAVDMRDVGKRIAKFILGIKEPEIGEGKVIVAGQEIEPSVIAGLPSDKIAAVKDQQLHTRSLLQKLVLFLQSLALVMLLIKWLMVIRLSLTAKPVTF